MNIIIEMIRSILIIAVLILFGCIATYLEGNKKCSEEWKGGNFAYENSFLGGCQIKKEQAGRIPAKNYRDGM